MEICLVTMRRWTKSIKHHINLYRTFSSAICTSTLHLEKYPALYRTSYNNKGIPQCSSVNNIVLRINTKSISTSCVMRKGRDKGEKKKSRKAQHIDLNEAREILDIDKFVDKMNQVVESLKNNFVKHLTLRTSAGSIEQIVVNFEGEEYVLQDLVQIVHKPKMVVLNAIDFPQAIPQILDAISKSGMNLNPQQDGTSLFIPIPKITKEYREGLAKNAKSLFIKSRDNIKDIKNKEVKNLKKIPSMSEDKIRRVEGQLEALCDEYVHKAQNILDDKQKELLRLD